jgi:LysR family transcriptional regulator, glycine cleavage system transcriptional activator
LSASLSSIKTQRTDAEITVSLLPVMAARWLVPRLPRFKARFPRINLHVKTSQSLANFKSDGVDIAIRFGAGDWKGLRATKLLDEEFSRYAVRVSTAAACRRILWRCWQSRY